ncbi:hypothetical protein NLU13_4877 [Sarocladium strictum]|uniref:Pentatricopeptide repeat-containing protein-mitochondrial domain-containing protein n=1 Tax=Sarocladium strictum TaxID=5046 RepID=A0AA39GKI0_SARSR|nr:hypothetical protein NLU13_4877 [Sarocladium strictum]
MMHPSPLAFDGLRRCLCPGVSPASWLAVMRGTTALQRLPRPGKRTIQSTGRPTSSRQIRTYHASVPKKLAAENQEISRAPAVAHHAALDPVQPEQSPTLDGTSGEVMRLLTKAGPGELALEGIPTEDITAALRILRQPNLSGLCAIQQDQVYDRIILLANFLVTRRGMRKTLFIYESLMDTMTDVKGSSHGAFELLRDMEKAGLQFSETICRSTLRVLTVHPHYSLQVFILQVMRENWYTIEPKDVQNVVLGLLRDDQDSLAYERFMEMITVGSEPELWVYDILIMTLGSKRFYDEMVEVFQLRCQRESSGDGYVNLVYHVLDCCSSSFHYAGTVAAWDIAVKGGLFNPSDGILDNVLSTAAREGDAELAFAAYEMLSSRTRILVEQHSALIEAFCTAQDFPRAFRMLSIIEGMGLTSAMDGMVRLVGKYLEESDDRDVFKVATETVRGLVAEGSPVVYCLRTLVRAIAGARGGEQAVELLREWRSMCGQEPDDETLRCMIKHTEDLDLRRTFVQQYRDTIPEAKQVACHATTYPGLISACIAIEAVDLALRFALEHTRVTKDEVMWKVIPWFAPIMQQAWDAKDDRFWEWYEAIMQTTSWRRRVKESIKKLVEDYREERSRPSPQEEEEEEEEEEGVGKAPPFGSEFGLAKESEDTSDVAEASSAGMQGGNQDGVKGMEHGNGDGLPTGENGKLHV